MERRNRVAALLREHARAFPPLARRAAATLDPEAIHKLRVLTRRIRAAVWVGRRLATSDALRRLRRRLRKLGRTLGVRRGLDVTVQDARAYRLDASVLDPEIASAGGALVRALAATKRARIPVLLREAARDVARSAEDRLPDALGRCARRLEASLLRAPLGKPEMHELRIEVKKTRYRLDVLGRHGGFLKPLQDRIGRAHDLEVLQLRLGASKRAARDEARERSAATRMMERLVLRAIRELSK